MAFSAGADSFPPFLFCLFNCAARRASWSQAVASPAWQLILSFLADGPLLALGVAERDVTYRLETDDSVKFSDLRKV